MLMNDLIKMRIFALLSEASQEVTNDELQNAYGELLEHIRCVNSTQNKSGSETETALPYFINLFFTWCS